MATITGGGSATSFSLGLNEATSVAASVIGAINGALALGTLTRVSSPTVAPASGNGLVQLTAAGSYAMPAADTTLLVAPGTLSATVAGSGGTGVNVLVADGVGTVTAPFVYNTNGGSGTIVTGDGTNLIGTTTVPGASSFYIQTGAGNDTVVAFSGNNTVSAGLGNNLIGTGTAGTSSNNLVFASGNDTITGGLGRGSDTVIANGGSTLVSPGAKNLTFLGTTGTATVIGGTGQETVWLGTGGGQAWGGTGGPNILLGGAGTAGSTLVGGANGDTLFARGSGQTVLTAGAGNETLYGGGSSGNNTFYTGPGNDLIGGGTGNDLIVVGASGNATIDGGAGADIVSFTFRPTGSTASVLINNFRPAEGDRVQLAGYGANQVAAIVGTAPSGNGTTVTLTDGTRITFAGVINLSASNFI